MEISKEEQEVRSQRRALRQRFLAGKKFRYELLAYAFLRGKTYEQVERRVSEHNLPRANKMQVEVNRLLEKTEGLDQPWTITATPEVVAWLALPEDRIKRFGPRVPKIRASNQNKTQAAELSVDKLFVVVRADLSPAQQAVQAVHAARQFAADHQETELSWFTRSNHLAFLAVPTESDILCLATVAAGRDLRLSLFREPDLGDSVTAIALEPKAKNLCRGLPLALADEHNQQDPKR